MEKAVHSNVTIALIPMGIPAIGKSKVFETLMKNAEARDEFDFDSVSSDDIRKQCMDEYMLKHPKAAKEDAFQGSLGGYKSAFPDAIKKAVSKERESTKKIHCIIIDKNHPNNALGSSVKPIEKDLAKGQKLICLGLTSKESSKIKHKGESFPFSYSTVLYCIKRVLQRKEHSTLTCEDEVKAVHVVVFFLKLYKNAHIALASVADQGIKDIVELPLTPTIPEIPEELLSAFHSVLENTQVKDKECSRPDLVKLLIDQIKKHAELFAKEGDLESNAKELLEVLRKWKTGVPPPGFAAPKPAPEEKKGGKFPVFLGIDIETPTPALMDFVLRGCKEIGKNAAIDPKDDLSDLVGFLEEEKGGNWKYPNSKHVTVLFIGGNVALTEEKIYKEFIEGEKHEFNLDVVVIIPHKLVFGLCFPKTAIANKIPHISLLLKSCPPKMSNVFGEELFLKVPDLKAKYESGFFQKEGEVYMGVHQAKVEGKVNKAYVIKLPKGLPLAGINKKFL